MSYRRGTDWGAQVRARGTPCRQARRLAWDFRDRRYGVIRRYRCVTRERPRGDRASAQVHADSRCVRRGSRGRVVVTLVHY